MSYDSLGQWLKQRRKELDLTQKMLAGQVGCATVTIRKLEADQIRPSRELLERLARFLEIPADERPAFGRLARGLPLPQPAAGAAGGSSRPTPTNLMAPLNSLIGRERELDHVRDLLLREEIRLLALCGPPGIGKTRLSQGAGRDLLGDFADGVFFVALAPIANVDLVAATIAQALGVPETAGQPLVDSLKISLRDKQLLLILDNFEHVLEAAPIVTELLRAAPRLKALVTSRAVLSLYGEHDFWLPPLELPEPSNFGSPEALEKVASVQLFVQRAQAVNPDFFLNRANAAAVAELCTRLDGLPLAIELAASRSGLFGPRALLKRLDHRFELLAGSARNLPPRHRTLHGAIEWSYDLLDEGEQVLYRRMGVFAGSFDLAAVAALCDSDLSGSGEVLAGIASLVNKSLLQRVMNGSQQEGTDLEDEPRFLMLETIRVHAREQLEAGVEAAAIRERHAEYYLALAETPGPARAGPQPIARLDRLEIERPNLLVALDWFIGQREVKKSLRLASALVGFWAIRGYLTEGRQMLRAALALVPEGEPDPEVLPSLALALNGAGHLALDQGDAAAAPPLLEASLKLWRELGDEHHIAWALYGLALAAYDRSGPAAAHRLMEESLEVSRAAGDLWCRARALELQGVALWNEANYPAARANLEECLRIFRELGDLEGVALALMNLGKILMCQGLYQPAQQAGEESLAIFQELGYRRMMAGALDSLGRIAFEQGNFTAAVSFYEESLAAFRQIGVVTLMAWMLAHLALVRRQEGDLAAARVLLAESLERAQNSFPRILALSGLGFLALDEGNFLEARRLFGECLADRYQQEDWRAVADCLEAIASANGFSEQSQRAATLYGAAEALRDRIGAPLPPVRQAEYRQAVSSVRAALGDGGFEAAWAEGRALGVEEAVALALDPQA